MKHNFKKILTVCLIASLSVAAFGCSKNNNSSEAAPEAGAQETISLDQTKVPLTFEHETGAGNDAAETTAVPEDAAESGEEGEAPATTAPSQAETKAASTSIAVVPVTEYVKVTDDKGQPVTDADGQEQTEAVPVVKVVPMTDTAGQPVTDAAGNQQTETVTVTETVVVTEPVENPATLSPIADPNQTVTEVSAPSGYSPSYDLCKAYWLDMSQEGDFFFEGEFLIIEFEVNQDIPDGSYPVSIEKADIASWDVVSWDPEIINGEVAVNTELTAQPDMPEKDFALKVKSVQAKQGDTVKVVIDLKNNPGFCGFVMDIQYDKSAMTIVDTYGGENFKKTAINYIAK